MSHDSHTAGFLPAPEQLTPMNKNRLHTLLALLPLLLFGFQPAAAQGEASTELPFSHEWIGNEAVRLRFPLTASDSLTGRDYAVCYTPLLVSGTRDTLRLSSVIFRGTRNRRRTERQRYFGETAAAQWAEPAAGDTLWVERTVTLAEAPWLLNGRQCVQLLAEREGCCRMELLPERQLGCFAYIPPFVPRIQPVEDNTGKAGELQRTNPVLQHISKYRPYDETRILRKESDMLFVNFPLNKTTLLHDFRSNGPTLDTIVSITRQIMADTTSTVKLIQIVGLASVEGSISHNCRLAEQRAVALRQYIQQRVPSANALYEICNGCEGWSELRDQINDSDFEGREGLLDIIDHTPDANERERRMKRYQGGRPWAYVRQNILQDQRNSGYLRIYYDYVPDSAAAVINAASALLQQDRAAEALSQLRTVQADPRSWNALGTALYLTGQEAEGMAYIRRAAEQGNPQAIDNLQQMEAITAAREAAQ